ncbi:MAG TPA: head GIN domain-containing protein [Flavipsychrobacter sp.]|nr:head GIN domain-containing protein [Flavipsychrobacter sp.]
MRTTSIIMAGLVATTVFTSCSKNFIKGEGRTLTESRDLAEFNAIEANGSVEVEIVSSNENRVEITGYQNLIPVYETDVRNGKLVLEYDDDYINVKNDNLKVKVYSTGVNHIDLNGSGDINAGSDIGTSMSAEVNGSGKIRFATNYFTSFKPRINGSGEIEAKDATSEEVRAEISGSGDIDVRVTRYLRAYISGSGIIDYWGNPSDGVDTEISGSGKVRKN